MNLPTESSLEQSLNQLSPEIPTALRDRMMFAAGQQAAKQQAKRAVMLTAFASCLITLTASWGINSTSSRFSRENSSLNQIVKDDSPTAIESQADGTSPNAIPQQLQADLSRQFNIATTRSFKWLEQNGSLNPNQVSFQSVSDVQVLTPRTSLEL
jgi:hypothetical protein